MPFFSLNSPPFFDSVTLLAKVNDDAHRRYNTNSQIKLKSSMLKSNLCDYSDLYILHILAEGNIAITGNAGPPEERTEQTLTKSTEERNS